MSNKYLIVAGMAWAGADTFEVDGDEALLDLLKPGVMDYDRVAIYALHGCVAPLTTDVIALREMSAARFPKKDWIEESFQ